MAATRGSRRSSRSAGWSLRRRTDEPRGRRPRAVAPFVRSTAIASFLLLAQLTGTGRVGAAAFAAALGCALVLGLMAWQVGGLTLRLLLGAGADSGPPPPAAGLALAAGVAVLAQLAHLLTLLGALRLPVLVVVVAVLLAASWRWPRRRDPSVTVAAGRRPLPPAWLVAGGATFAAALLLMALYPPAAFDETTYHLPMARAYAATGALPILPDLRFPLFPALLESLQAALWLAGGELATHLVAAVAAAGVALLLLGWDGLPEGSRRLAAAAWVGAPIVLYLGGTGYLEPALALFTAGALLAVQRWRAGGATGWCALAGLLAGSAAAAKYTGLLVVAWLAGEVAWAGWRERRWRALGAFAAAAAVAAAPTYLRLVVLTGNPVFPFLAGWFGESAWAFAPPGGVGAHLAAVATSLWDLVARRERLGSLPPYTPLLPLLGVLAALAAVRRSPIAWRCGGLAAAFLLLSPLHGHYLVAVLPALVVAAACALAGLPSRRLAAVLAVAIALPGPLYAASWWLRFGPPPATAAQRDAYLAAMLPGYSLLAALERHGGGRSVVYGLGVENLRYHVPGRLRGEMSGPDAFARVAPAGCDPAALAARLRAREAEFLLATNAWLPAGCAGQPEWRRHFAPVAATGDARLDEVLP